MSLVIVNQGRRSVTVNKILYNINMKNFISILSIVLITKISLVTPNVLSRREAKTILKQHVNELNTFNNLNLFSQRPQGGNDNPTGNDDPTVSQIYIY